MKEIGIVGDMITSMKILSGKYSDTGKSTIPEYTHMIKHFPLEVKSVDTKGKFSWITLDSGWFIWITYGMSGSIKYERSNNSRLEFKMLSGAIFYYEDPRNFGNIVCSKIDKLTDKLNTLGHDIMQSTLDKDAIYSIFTKGRSDKNICTVLMDQSALAGVGNYIKSEALYRSRIDPRCTVGDLTKDELYCLYRKARRVAKESYTAHGASLYTFSGAGREKGDFQKVLRVYNIAIDPFGNKVVKIQTPDKRMTHWVPEVQLIGKAKSKQKHKSRKSTQTQNRARNIPTLVSSF